MGGRELLVEMGKAIVGNFLVLHPFPLLGG